jgi:hypothetical protein
VNDNAVEAVVDKRQQIAEQLGEHVHGRHHEIRYGPNNHQTWSRQAQGRWQEPPSRRRDPLHPTARRRPRRARRDRRSTRPVLTVEITSRRETFELGVWSVIRLCLHPHAASRKTVLGGGIRFADQDTRSAVPARQIQLAHLKTVVSCTNFLDQSRDYFAFLYAAIHPIARILKCRLLSL